MKKNYERKCTIAIYAIMLQKYAKKRRSDLHRKKRFKAVYGV